MLNKTKAARGAFVLALALAATAAGFCQEGPFVIRSVDFRVQGRTLAFVLMQKVEADGPVIGRSFEDEATLDAYIEDRRQTLSNNRVLASVEASRETEPDPSGGSAVRVTFGVVDTWNIAFLPKPAYNSNDGWNVSLKGKDYNFAGSMQPLSLDISYVEDLSKNRSVAVSTSFDLPFRAMGREWSLGVSEDFEVWSDGTWASGTAAGITLNLPDLGFPANIQAKQGFYYNEDQPTLYEPDPLYLSDSLTLSASIPTGLALGERLGAVTYGPSLSLAQNWWPTASLDYAGRAGTVETFANSLSAGRIDWMGNMRHGLSASLGGTQSYNFYSRSLGLELDATLSGYQDWLERRIGLAARLNLVDIPFGDGRDLGGYLRGIKDSRAPGVACAVANLSVPVKLFDFPTHLLIKKNWLDFELQAQPFLDAGLVVPGWGEGFDKKWLWASGGLELLVYPAIMRSFIVRASIGWDLESVIATRSLTALSPRDDRSPYEIFIGTGVAY